MRENFSVFNARECFVSHLKSPDHSLTLLTLITAVILSAVASVSRTEGPVASRRCVVFLVLVVLGKCDESLRPFFLLGSVELDWVSVLSYKLYGFFVLVKKIAITISNSKKNKTLCVRGRTKDVYASRGAGTGDRPSHVKARSLKT